MAEFKSTAISAGKYFRTFYRWVLLSTVTGAICGLVGPVLSSLLDAIQLHLDRRAAGAFRVGAVLFSNQYGPLGQTRTAKELLDEWKNG